MLAVEEGHLHRRLGHGNLVRRLPPHLDVPVFPGQPLRPADRQALHRPARQHHFLRQPETQAAPHGLGQVGRQGAVARQSDFHGGDLVRPRVLCPQRVHHRLALAGEVHRPVVIQPVGLTP